MSKHFKPQAKDVMEFVEKYNPFGFKDDKGEIMLFSDYHKIYEYTFKALYESCGNGYCDLALFIHQNTQMPLADCSRHVKMWSRKKEDVLEIDWTSLQDSRTKLIEIVNVLHCISETKINHNMLNLALGEFIEFLNKEMHRRGAELN